MATFYSSSTNQRNSVPNLCLRDPANASYMESSAQGNLPYLNFSSSTPYSDSLAGNSESQHNYVLLPAPSTVVSQSSFTGAQNMVPSQMADHTFNSRRNEMSFMRMIDGSANRSENLAQNPLSDDTQMGLRPQLITLNGQSFSSQQPNVSAMQNNQGLSLSLGTQIPLPNYQYQPTSADISFIAPNQSSLGNTGSCGEDNMKAKQVHMNVSPYGYSTLASSIPNSKYLKAAQELLDEVANVRKTLKKKEDKSQSLNTCKDTDGGSKAEGASSNPQEDTADDLSELSPAERQDLQNKVTKLLAMLDEVDRRYRQYYHQMQIVVSSFDAIAGCGASKPYTTLALQTISRQFRCLRDAINSQIQATRRSLGEQDTSSKGNGGISRLRYIDQQIRQQRAMQQFGMMQHNAWRPQRGLPESSVSILRAWLFEHFLHPYPKDSEKLMLARQTGLTRSQVSNWFINARVRLWKPMIEEMYKEELGDAQIDSNSSSDNQSKGRNDMQNSDDCGNLQSPATEKCATSQLSSYSKVDFAPTMNPNLTNQNHNVGGSILLQEALNHSDGNSRLMAYQMAELGHYGNGGVSLTLGLQHNNGSFLGSAPIVADAEEYGYMNMEDRRERFEGG
ncbi:BEL1-like homeodomain protein 7 isoform X2 [Ananas comosus]|uniref:BEL1-like homeodomain protein 7 isoform X2 n=1 Tax=Ananas comosus TaxID=4615 RepID=A0A6P5EEY7_ANACO|nr:BEL1-like homeodomain protein 7 isoform X2 [Ananas comosus]XP_020081859.1 BEL1-like homeodomain protein 7 isoform X2 [Ananas comosus]XP_020081921.1 BEL1-like homeodomain protein 7 isoform X2 [Ananas comosus]XP_020081984.1 BEL1-like homeodomain protein 7 isoform X2 [Ananas comosus]